MSWDSGAVDFSSGGAQVDFSSGNVQSDSYDNSSSNNYNDQSYGEDNQGERRQYGGDRPPRPPPTEEQMAHRSYNWASNRARYEYNENVGLDEFGMAPRDEALEAELFGEAASENSVLDFSKYKEIPVRVERGTGPAPIPSFDAADLHPVMKENVKLAHYSVPTPVQTHSIPIVTSGKDLMACAQTGSGKTAAFLIPTLSSLFYNAKELQKPRPAPYELRHYKAEPLVLIIAPTRELCSQIFDECRKFTYRSCLRPCAVYGGADSVGQLRQIERGCDILAASPGRLMDFIQRGKIGLDRVKYLILDEADRMLDMGFEAIIRNIIQKNGMNPARQTLLFSATFPRAIRALARDFLKPDYLFLKVGRVGGTSNSIAQKVMYVEEDEKREALRNLLNNQPPTRTLIFVETKRSADSLDQYLYERSFPSTSIHGDRTQMEREDALLAFKRGKCPILVATAVAARGIDIRNVMHVVNYDMPQDMDEYIHRIGRTARVGKSGLATSFFNSRSDNIAPELTKLLKECKQPIPDFLEPYLTEDMTWDEDLDDNEVEAPSYAGQEYVPLERTAPGAPQGFNNAEPTGAADAAWDSGNTGRPGDWNCPECQISNFASRRECFKCATPKPEGEGAGGDYHSGAKPGDWDCPECQISNFASRYRCFKCNADRPEGLGAPRREPRARREGDWDCTSCSAVNFSNRTECYKCHAGKEGGEGGYGDYGYGDDTGNADAGNFESANWDSSKGWGQSEPEPTPQVGGWGQSEPVAAAPQAGGWGQSEPVAAAPQAGGWGQSEPVAAAPQAGGWGQTAPEPVAAAAPQAGGWGQTAPEPVAAAAPQAGGWGQTAPEPVAAAAPQAGGWGQPEPVAAAPQAGGWGQPEPVAAAPQAGGWGQPTSPVVKQQSWGQPASSPVKQSPVQPAHTSPVAHKSPVVKQQQGWGQPAETESNGWGAPPATTGDGWGAPPAAANGSGW